MTNKTSFTVEYAHPKQGIRKYLEQMENVAKTVLKITMFHCETNGR